MWPSIAAITNQAVELRVLHAKRARILEAKQGENFCAIVCHVRMLLIEKNFAYSKHDL